jgi:hypothetical protein
MADANTVPGLGDQPWLYLGAGGGAAPAMTPEEQAAAEHAELQSALDAQDRADMTRGAVPADTWWRIPIGAAADDDQALAWLREMQIKNGGLPDAVPLPGVPRQFIFTDPTNHGALTHYGGGFDPLGDIASMATDAAGVLGGTGGALGGSAVEPGVGTVVGAGLGYSAAQEALRQAIRLRYGLTETRGPGDIAVQMGGNAALGAAGEGFGRYVLTPAMNTMVDAAKQAITPTARPVVGAIDRLQASGYPGADTMRQTLPAGVAQPRVANVENALAQISDVPREANQAFQNAQEATVGDIGRQRPPRTAPGRRCQSPAATWRWRPVTSPIARSTATTRSAWGSISSSARSWATAPPSISSRCAPCASNWSTRSTKAAVATSARR